MRQRPLASGREMIARTTNGADTGLAFVSAMSALHAPEVGNQLSSVDYTGGAAVVGGMPKPVSQFFVITSRST